MVNNPIYTYFAASPVTQRLKTFPTILPLHSKIFQTCQKLRGGLKFRFLSFFFCRTKFEMLNTVQSFSFAISLNEF